MVSFVVTDNRFDYPVTFRNQRGFQNPFVCGVWPYMVAKFYLAFYAVHSPVFAIVKSFEQIGKISLWVVSLSHPYKNKREP